MLFVWLAYAAYLLFALVVAWFADAHAHRGRHHR
jgi:hypothetical protein